MIGAVAGVLLQVGVASFAAMPGVDSVPRDPAVDSLRIAEMRFLSGWRKEFMAGKRARYTYVRLASLHCHHDGSWKSGAPNIIRSKDSRRSFCPIWFPVDDSLAADEGEDGIDAALGEESRTLMRRLRASLIERFESAARTRPSNPWLVGQLVRLAVDQKETETALRAARACAASTSWCLLLEGYTQHAAGRIATADSVFTRALAAMKAPERCQWASVAPLLDARARAAYERIDCEKRDSVHATFWWLADPLYIEPGNARRADHFARQVLVRLHAALSADERWDWRADYGGDALATMIVRYGWPSHFFWAGRYEDGGHFDWLGFVDNSINVAPEYRLPRYHSTPSWSAVLDPSAPSPVDGSRFAPRMGYGGVDWESDFWPIEHAERRAGPVLDLAEQLVMFRRDNDALLAIAMDVPQKFFAPGAGLPYDAAIIAARDPNDRWVPSRESIVLDGRGTTVLVSPLAPRAQVVSAELAPADGAPGLAVRARRAVHPPQPLSVLQAGEIAISDPLFFRPGEESVPPTDVESAIARMIGSLSLSEKRIGVFWETYGVAPADTVQLTLRITSLDKPGLLRRIGASIGMAEAAGGEIAMGWSEPRLGNREGLTWVGDVPVQARAVVLDFSRLRAGRYTVEISVAKRGTEHAVTRREVTVVR